MKKMFVLVLTLASVSPFAGTTFVGPASAAFEGILHMKFSGNEVDGTSIIYISPQKGIRQEMSMSTKNLAKNMQMKSTTLINPKYPNKAFILNDESKTYNEIDTSDKDRVSHDNAADYTVKPLGELTIAGYACQNYLVTHKNSGEMELCINKEFMNYAEWNKLNRRDANARENEGIFKALRDAGGDGFPIRSVHRTAKEKDSDVTFELVKAEKKSLSASIFNLPSDYKKSKGLPSMGMGGGTGGAGAGSAAKSAAPSMNTEAQEMFKKMMKQKMGK